MTRFLGLLTMVVVLGLPLRLHAASSDDLRFMAEITGTLTPDAPVRVPLSPQIIAATHNAFADLRLFDSHGQETPYVIYASRASHPTPSLFTFTIVSYSQDDAVETIILERPANTGAFQEIDLVTTARDFHKAVQVQTSHDQTTWVDHAADTIFDYSARLTLRKTTMDIPPVNARYVRLRFQDVVPATGQSGDLTLRYDGLELSMRKGEARTFRIDKIVGRSSTEPPVPAVYDRVSLAQPDTQTDGSGNTVLSLGHLNLPVTEVTLSIDTLYYHRAVELWTADVDTPEAYRQVASSVVYNIPGMQIPRNTLRTSQAQLRYVQLKIVNGDNPPLRLQQVTVAWPRHHLYFIPEAGRRYALYCGSEQRRAPVYELRYVLPFNPAGLVGYPVVSVGPLQQNPAYRPSASQNQFFTDKSLFTGLVLLLACALGVWMYRLIQRLPAQ
jgi:hypothetical protein